MPKMYLTHASVDAVPLSDTGTVWYYDTQTSGFCLAAGSRKKTFYIGKSLNGKNIRVRLGEYPAVKVAKARKDAEGMVGDISRGLDPRAQRREAAEKAKRERTVEQVMEAYIAENTRPGSVKMSQATARAYRDTFRLYGKGLLRRKISSITHEEVVALHNKLAPIVIDEHGNETRPHFVYVANNTARTIRTLQRYAGIALPDFSFFDENSRVNGIKPDGRRNFGRAIARVPCTIIRSANPEARFQFVTFSGDGIAEQRLALAASRADMAAIGISILVPKGSSNLAARSIELRQHEDNSLASTNSRKNRAKNFRPKARLPLTH